MLFSFASHSPSPQSPGDEVGLDPSVDEAEQVRQEIRSTLATLTPWGLSILVHMLLVVLAFFLVWQTIIPDERQQTIPQLARTPEIMASPDPLDDTEAAPPSDAPNDKIEPIIVPPSVVIPVNIGVTHSKVPFTETPDIKPPTQVTKNNGFIGKKIGLFGTGIQGDGDGEKDGDPDGSLTKVVYLVDASGSMVDVLPFVVNELKRVVNTELGPEHQVTVIFFSGEGVFETPGGGKAKGLRPVNAAFKQRFNQWVTLENHHVRAGGRGSAYVRQALATALAYKPEAIFLLSDNLTGGGQGATRHELFQDELMTFINKQNKSTPATKVSTIQFLYEDPLVYAGLTGTLQRIADENGGVYNFITQQDLNLR